MAEENPKGDTRTGEPARNKKKNSFEHFDDLMTKLLAVPKEELDEQRAKYKGERKGRRVN